MRKIISVTLAVIFLCSLLAGCAGEKAADGASTKADSAAPAGPTAKTSSPSPTPASASSGKQTYENVKTIDVPAAYPSANFPLSKASEDKVIEINSYSDGVSFDIKIISTRSAKEIIEEYAKLWELENENTIFLSDIGSATLTGTRDGFEAFVNGSEQSPALLEGAKTYLGLLVRKKAS